MPSTAGMSGLERLQTVDGTEDLVAGRIRAMDENRRSEDMLLTRIVVLTSAGADFGHLNSGTREVAR